MSQISRVCCLRTKQKTLVGGTRGYLGQPPSLSYQRRSGIPTPCDRNLPTFVARFVINLWARIVNHSVNLQSRDRALAVASAPLGKTEVADSNYWTNTSPFTAGQKAV